MKKSSISQSEAARRAGVSRAAIQKHLASGRIVSDGSRVDITSFEEWLAERTDLQPEVQPGLQVADGVAPINELRPDLIPDDARQQIEAGMAPYSTKEAIRIEKNYAALSRKLDYDLKAGTVVESAKVVETVGEEYARVRTKLLAMAAEKAPSLHRCKTVAEVQDRLTTLVTRVLEELTADGDPAAG
ncbi:hypothetical protein [Novacetimonas sp. GS1]|uniref:hypothetical protein n=1 Tax=Novacetimonas sp. GS1 TaxID=3119990 RepID=UPI002FCCF163